MVTRTQIHRMDKGSLIMFVAAHTDTEVDDLNDLHVDQLKEIALQHASAADEVETEEEHEQAAAEEAAAEKAAVVANPAADLRQS